MPTSIRQVIGAAITAANASGTKYFAIWDPATVGTSADGLSVLTVAEVQTLLGISSGNPVAALTIPSPGASEDVTVFYTKTGFTISEIRSVCGGSVSTPSVTFTVRYAADRSATGTEVVTGGTTCTNSTTGLATTVFNAATIPANRYVWVETTATSGTVGNLNVSIFA